MAYIAVISHYPPGKQTEVAAVYSKLDQNPSPTFTKRVGPFTWGSCDDVEAFSAFEVRNNKLYDGLIELTARMNQYAGVEGYRWDVRVVAGPGDAEKIRPLIAALQAKK
jgi:hypothetical protein